MILGKAGYYQCSVFAQIKSLLFRRLLFRTRDHIGNQEDLALLKQRFEGLEFWFPNDRGKLLHACLFGPFATSSTILLYSMGNDGDIARRVHVLSLLLETGIPVFIYEYSGFGLSEGKPSLKRICQDACDAFDFIVKKLGKEPCHVVLYGESLGGAVSVQLSSVRRPQGIILKSTFTTLTRLARELCPALRFVPAMLLPDLNSIDVLRASKTPVMVLHGSKDRMIKCRHANDLYRAIPNDQIRDLIWLTGSRHAFMEVADERTFNRSIKSFVDRLSKSTHKLIKGDQIEVK